MDEGGWFRPSSLQSTLAVWWNTFWREWVPEVCRREPFAVCVNGDTVDGHHHNAVTQWTHNLQTQRAAAREILAPIVELCEGRFYMIRGTEAHVGPSGQEEEELARSLGAIPDEVGRFARYELWVRVGHGMVHLTHHIGTTGSMHYESTAPMRELAEAYVEAGRWGDETPDVVVRSHRHRNVEVRVQTHKGFATCCTTPGWQLKTPFAYRIAGARQAMPQIGGTLVRCGDEDIYTRHKVWSLKRPTVETIPSQRSDATNGSQSLTASTTRASRRGTVKP